jgi:hypothetical protein
MKTHLRQQRSKKQRQLERLHPTHQIEDDP